MRKRFSKVEARAIGNAIGIDWRRTSLDEFTKGLAVELEHRDVTGGDPYTTGRIAASHLRELRDYYTRLAKMERQNPRLYELVVDIRESKNLFPIVTHVFRGRTKQEARHYFESHLSSDKFMRDCVQKGVFAGSVQCRTTVRWRVA